MSKAFTREDDDAPERPLTRAADLTPPPGVRNYVTAAGYASFRGELERLEQTLPTVGTDPGELARIDGRIRQLRQILRSAEPVPPATDPEAGVRFGATVTVREPDGAETTYRLVGVPEVDYARNWISWRSPLAQALMKTRPGHRIPLPTPGGNQVLEVVSVRYQ